MDKPKKHLFDFMKEHTEVERVPSTGKKYAFEPGNGTQYTLLIIPMGNLDLGMLGCIENGYLIINGLTGKAHLFSAPMYVESLYVRENLFNGDPSWTDVMCVTAMIAWALNEANNVNAEYISDEIIR